MRRTRIVFLALLTTGAVLSAQEEQQVPDLRKVLVEGPLKKALKSGADGEKHGLLLPGGVQPGLVAWHDSFESARQAATRSGRPVLLFQLLGRLDEEFC